MKSVKTIFPVLKSRVPELFTGVLMVATLAFLWLRRTEVSHVSVQLRTGNAPLILTGILLTFVYIFMHAWMYQASFRAVGQRVPVLAALRLFLKRNLTSLFLPGGGVTSLALFTGELESQGVSRAKINLASYIYGAIGIVSLVMIAFPVLIYEGLSHSGLTHQWTALASLAVLTGSLAYLPYAIGRKNGLYRLICKIPSAAKLMDELSADHLILSQVTAVLFFSILIELAGMAHLYIAMLALGLHPEPGVCIAGYTVATLFLCISPFLRGLGAVELSLTLILVRSGLSQTAAIAVTVLYRFFEFWLPLLAGAISFLVNKVNIFFRIFPPMLIFFLGTVNMISVLTPAIANRMEVLKEFLPTGMIDASNYLVLNMGMILIITSVFLFRGFKNAWYLALVVSALSLVGHLTKAIDYEESVLAALAIGCLLVTRHQYFIKSNRSIQLVNLETAIRIMAVVLIYGLAGFYFLDKTHFGIDFSFEHALSTTLDNFFLLNSQSLLPQTGLAKLFLYSINISGFGSLALVFYAFLRPYVMDEISQLHAGKAQKLLARYGQSPVDYFKVYPDKKLFFGTREEGFIAYKLSGHFAIVLEEPVCRDQPSSRKALLAEFEKFCLANSKRPFYYRIGEKNVDLYTFMGKKSMLIGQEAVVDIESFTMEGKQRKSLRNAVNSVYKKGYTTKVYPGNLAPSLISRLKEVSDEWLESMGREEMVFSQGMFNWEEIKNHTVITLEDENGKIEGFLNIIPDYAPGEATYDMIRKTKDAPGGIMDVLIIELIDYSRKNGFKMLNLGLAPMSGIGKAKDIPEQTIKFAYEKIESFRHYRGLRDFKDKFDPLWENKYLIYQYPYDLLQLPQVLNKVMKP